MHFSAAHSKTQHTDPGDGAGCSSYLLWVVGHVRQHGGHVEHDLVALVAGVQGVGARRVRWRKIFQFHVRS